MNHYSKRNDILAEIGFASYEAYLQSPVWASIRTIILSTMKGRCCACNAKANQVHHEHYSRGNLTGESLDGLKSICKPCHTYIEHDDAGYKLMDMTVVSQRLAALITDPAIREGFVVQCRATKQIAIQKAKKSKPKKKKPVPRPFTKAADGLTRKQNTARRKAERAFSQGKTKRGTNILRKASLEHLILEMRDKYLIGLKPREDLKMQDILRPSVPKDHDGIPFSLTAREAVILGLEYPLQKVWRKILKLRAAVEKEKVAAVFAAQPIQNAKALDDIFSRMFPPTRPVL